MRRQWVVRIPNLDGGEHVLVLAAPSGLGRVRAYVDGVVLDFDPKLISKLRRAFHEAQAAALWDKGEW